MATTMIPPTVPPSAPSPAGGIRFVAIRANLMPDEIISKRHTEVVGRKVVIALVVLVALLVAGYGLSWFQTNSARSDLDAAQRRGVALQNQQQVFAPLVQAQAGVDAIHSQLQSLMVGDLSWKGMLTTLRAKAPNGVSITTVTGNVNSAGAAPGAAVLNPGGKASVGQLTITGTAPDKKTTAAYADKLGAVKGLTAPLISSITSGANSVTFTLSVVITTDALGGRYATTAAPLNPTTGGN